MERKKSVSDPNIFCYIFGRFMIEIQNITLFVKRVYISYFGMKLGDQGKPWTPHKVCSACVAELRNWLTGKTKALSFGVPMVWREPKNLMDDCYFCICQVKGFMNKSYPDLESARRPVPHGADVLVPKPLTNLEILQSETSSTPVESAEVFPFEIYVTICLKLMCLLFSCTKLCLL